MQLSGGIDSAAVFSILDNLHPGKIKTYSMNFYDENMQEMNCDEHNFQKLIHKNSSNHTKLQFNKESPYSNVDNWLRAYDQPFNLANVYLFEKLHKHASKKEMKTHYSMVLKGMLLFLMEWERFRELFKFHSILNFFYELGMFSKKHNYEEYSKSNLFFYFKTAC